jgi:hypothetical protein
MSYHVMWVCHQGMPRPRVVDGERGRADPHPCNPVEYFVSVQNQAHSTELRAGQSGF